MMLARWKGLSSLAVIAAAATACDGPASEGSVDVTMQQTQQALAQAVSGWHASIAGGSGSAAAIKKDTVDKLVARITRIEFLPKQNENQAADDNVWQSFPLATPVLVDLMKLPTEGQSPVVIASGSVAVGNYGDVRLFVDSVAIVFKGSINLGAAFSFEGGKTYQVTLPSGQQTGIKTDAEFTVEEDTDVNLLFSPDATFLNVTATGAGQVILAPVIKARP